MATSEASQPKKSGRPSPNHNASGPLPARRDAQTDLLVTTVLQAAEAHYHALRGTGADPPDLTHALPDEGLDQGASQEFAGLARLLVDLRRLLADDPLLAEQLDRLPEGFGDGADLTLLFRSLFPEQRPRPIPNPRGERLSPRELQVLRSARHGYSAATIAERLKVSRRTVETHLHRVYRKLGVHSAAEAVARATALGYLTEDEPEFAWEAARHVSRPLQPFRVLCIQAENLDPAPDMAEVGPLASLGLLLLLMSGSLARETSRERLARQEPGAGLVCELDPGGRVVRRFGEERLGQARAIVVAPAAAARQGFAPGNLFVLHDLLPPRGLNRAAIAEFTPDGRYLRSFCGGREIGSRLVGPLSAAFAADGRLLVTSGWLTDGILAFRDGGRRVRRFASGEFWQVCLGPKGLIYATHKEEDVGRVQVFDSCGRPAADLAGTLQPYLVNSVAVDSRGRLFVTRDQTVPNSPFQLRHLEEYNADGEFVRLVSVPGARMGLLAIDHQDRLYLPCWKSGTLTVIGPDSQVLRHLDLRETVSPMAAAVSETGRLWVCGSTA